MKKFISILLTAVISLSLFAFGACAQGDGKTYDINEYFTSVNAPYDIARFIGSEEPTGRDILSLEAKKDVKIKKISGTAYYNYEWYIDISQDSIDLKMPLPDSKFMTTTLVENVELTKNMPTHFDFVMTKESVRNGMDSKSYFPDVLKAGNSFVPYFSKTIEIVAIRNLKVEFEPA